MMFDARCLSPIAFNIGSFQIYWYGLSYILGLVLALISAKHLCQSKKLSIQSKDIDRFFSWACLAIIVGGRLGHVLFFEPAYYFSHFFQWFNLRQGGMSFHGGLIGIVLAAFIFCKKYSLNKWQLADIAATVAPIGLFFGRMANFINNELYGKVTSVPWGVIFRVDSYPRHPVQLYEAFSEGLILFFVLQVLWTKPKIYKQSGLIASVFLIEYALFRTLIDFWKETSLTWGLTPGQWLSLGMLILGGIIFFQKRHKSENLL